MTQIINKIHDFIDLLERRPGFFLTGAYTYAELAYLLQGYLQGLEDADIKLNLNSDFSKWVSKAYGQPSSLFLAPIYIG